ncbi:MAG: dTDP-4-dehydrorhamnose 3,5-epimerase family protein [Geodermatophilaceae bacterium]
MQVRPLSIGGAVEFTPRQHVDQRGLFLEWFRADALGEGFGPRLKLAQANLSVSARGVVRGIHYASVPPGQAKYVTCISGRVLDVVVDVRVGSPTFGTWDSVILDDTDRRAVYLAEGLGHGFCALTDQAAVTYLCSEPYTPEREHAINAFDVAIGIDWGIADLTLSDRDSAAPSLAEARAARMLPDFAECNAYVQSPRETD